MQTRSRSTAASLHADWQRRYDPQAYDVHIRVCEISLEGINEYRMDMPGVPSEGGDRDTDSPTEYDSGKRAFGPCRRVYRYPGAGRASVCASVSAPASVSGMCMSKCSVSMLTSTGD